MDFDESEVMFSDYLSDQSVESENEDQQWKYDSQSDGSRMMMMNMNSRKGLKKKQPGIRSSSSSSVPVNIPKNEMSSFTYDDHDTNEDDYQLFDEIDDQMTRLPPHLIIERRVNEEVARSFSPLKGKNLCDVRNSILRMTGFLEG